MFIVDRKGSRLSRRFWWWVILMFLVAPLGFLTMHIHYKKKDER